jgi:SAM-dependent methyltransferase
MYTGFIPYLYSVLGVISATVVALWAANFVSYGFIKVRTLRERRWDYNICCGSTDGGGINADIVQHGPVPRFEKVEDVTRLPHPDGRFGHVLCSHTLEHVDDPRAMFEELRRVGQNVTVLVPPLWDVAAALNPFEHRVIFLTLRSRHENSLPPYMPFAFGKWLQGLLGQEIRADRHRADLIATEVEHPGMRRMKAFVVPVVWSLAATLLLTESETGFLILSLGLLLPLAGRLKPVRT